jgi:hypothetical protein
MIHIRRLNEKISDSVPSGSDFINKFNSAQTPKAKIAVINSNPPQFLKKYQSDKQLLGLIVDSMIFEGLDKDLSFADIVVRRKIKNPDDDTRSKLRYIHDYLKKYPRSDVGRIFEPLLSAEINGKEIDYNTFLKYAQINIKNPNLKIYSTGRELRSLDELQKEATPNKISTTKYPASGNFEQQVTYIKNNILSKPKYKTLQGIRPVIIQTILDWGPNESKNRFFAFINKIDFPMMGEKNYREKMNYLYQKYKKNTLDLSHDYLLNPTLWERNDKEFGATVRAFELCMDESAMKERFKDTSMVDVSKFFNGDKILPLKEILAIIEEWASNENEYSPEERDKMAEKGDNILFQMINDGDYSYDELKQMLTTHSGLNGKDLKDLLDKFDVCFEAESNNKLPPETVRALKAYKEVFDTKDKKQICQAIMSVLETIKL